MIEKKILDKYDVILMDLWGVVFDGNELYPQVYETLEKLYERNMKIVFFSNVPRRKKTVEKLLKTFGINKPLYHDIISSGELAYETLAKDKVFGKKYFHLGSATEILHSLEDYEEVHDAQKADFSIITSLLSSYDSYTNHYDRSVELAKEAIKAKLTLLCTNPDKISITKSGVIVYCPGMVTELYEKWGGEVVHFGKPHKIIYEYAMRKIRVKTSKVLAIGDSITNDIAGACNMNIASVLVCSGIHRHDFEIEIGEMPKGVLQNLKKKYSISPNYVVSLLRDLVF